MPRLFSLLMLSLMLGTATAQSDIVIIEDPWVREGPPGMAMLAGFMIIRNYGKEARSITAAEGPDYDHVELHRSMMKDGMARMIPQESIPVPPGGSVALKPGDYHLMLMQPKRPLVAGDSSEITLILDDGSRLTVNAPVKKGDGGMMHHHHRHE
jgi:copper(I)-binding protein